MNNKLKATAMDSVTELAPKVKRGRSTFNLPIKEYTSFNVGELNVISWVEVLPGDTFNVDLATFIRLTSPSKRAVMDNLHMDIYAFFVPNRFCDDSWVNIQGENAQAWVAPATSCSQFYLQGDSIQAGSLLNHLGLPLLTVPAADKVYFNIYPVYSYMKICNDWFRDENLQNEIPFDTTNNVYAGSQVPTINSRTIWQSGSLFKVAKYHDVFTSALPAPLKAANPVSIPLGSYAPVKLFNTSGNTQSAGTQWGLVGPLAGTLDNNSSTDANVYTGAQSYSGSLWTDLSTATAATINQLRLSFQLQKAYELDARSGTRYVESTEARFGVKNPDLRLGRSELLGHYRFDLNMAEVMSNNGQGLTAESTTDALIGDTYNQGIGAGSSKTGNYQRICVKSFTEHGIFMIVGCVRPDLTYQQGIEKYWNKKERWDFYEPIFSNIGEVPIMKSELYGGAILGDSVFGYQEAWYEYRYHQNHISGILASAANTGFDIFHYGLEYAAAPSLSSSFIQQSPNAVDRTLAFPSSTVDNFIANFQGTIKATRVMPLFSVPGLIDHF